MHFSNDNLLKYNLYKTTLTVSSMKRKVMLIGFCLTLLAMGLPQDVGAQGHGRVNVSSTN